MEETKILRKRGGLLGGSIEMGSGLFGGNNLETFFGEPRAASQKLSRFCHQIYFLEPFQKTTTKNCSKAAYGTASGRTAFCKATAQAGCTRTVRHWHTLCMMAERNYKIDLRDGWSGEYEKWKENWDAGENQRQEDWVAFDKKFDEEYEKWDVE